jgi:glycerophosphoryl diester phosphodiesterase
MVFMKYTSLIAIFLLVACVHTKKINVVQLPLFDKEGHRGCRGLMPENTIAAMLKAIDLGVTTLEMDAVVTKDGQVILSHEPFFNHDITTPEDGTLITKDNEKDFNIYKMTYAQTQRYDVGLKPHARFTQQQKIAVKKPLLKDVIAAVEAYAKQKGIAALWYNIETKTQPGTDNIYHPAPAPFVDVLMKVINEAGIAERAIIQSFDFRTLQYLHKQWPAQKTAMLIEEDDKRTFNEQIEALGFVPVIYSPAQELVNEQLIKNCHKQNIKIIPWTVNEKKRMDELKAMGVDGIITDYPNLFNE